MKQILIPVDFSDASLNAAKYAVALAGDFGADITLVHAMQPGILTDDSFLAPLIVTRAERIEAADREIQKVVRALSATCRGKISGLVEDGLPADVIQEVATRLNADVIVMGMKGRGKSNSMFGSVATTVVRRSETPVLLIPASADFQPPKRITLASDFHAEIRTDRYSLLHVLSKAFGSEVSILNVAQSGSMSKDEMIGKIRTAMAFEKVNHEFHSIEHRNVIEGINLFLKHQPTDLLIMLAHKRTLFERIFTKEHTREMSYETRVPLLVV